MRFRSLANRIARFISIILLLAYHVPAQTLSGRIHGRVSDPSGAIVTIKNAGGQTSTIKSDSSGTYDLKWLQSGKLTLTVIANGFEVYTQDIDIVAAQNLQVNISLTVSKQEAKIDVKDDEPGVSFRLRQNAESR